MIAVSASVPALLWRGELRVQGLLLRRPLVTALQSLIGVAIFIAAVLRTRDALMAAGPVHYLNVAVLVLSFTALMAANVTLLGERTGTLPWQLQRWAAGLPFTPGQVARLIVAFSTLRSGLFTLALLAAVAVGSLTTVRSPIAAAVIVASALVFPLLPVAIGLQWARSRGTSVPFAFTVVPLALGFSALSLPLPLTSGWSDTAARWIGLPGLMLGGRADLATAAVFLAAWTGVALVLLRPAALSLKDFSVSRGFGSSIWRLSRIPSAEGRWTLAFDVAVHRVRLRDVAEVLFLGAVSCSIVALQVFATGTLFGRVALVAGFAGAAATATLAGYVQMRSTVLADDVTEAWIRTLPLSARDLAVARHAICTAGALLAVVPVTVLALVRADTLAPIGLALWSGLSAWALSGWFASYLSARGFLKHLGGYALFGWFAIRAAIGASVLITNTVPAVLALLLVDFVIGAAGHFRGGPAAAREPVQ
jgi:hypothetical protein